MQIFKATYNRLRDLAFSADGQLLASAGGEGKSIWLWDLSTGRKRQGFLSGHEARINCLAFAPVGTLLCSGDAHGHLYFWDAATRGVVGITKPQTSKKPRPIRCVAFSPEGRAVVVVGAGSFNYFLRIGEKRSSKVWSAILGKFRWEALQQGRARLAHCLALAPNMKSLAVGTNDSVEFWNLARGLVVNSWRFPQPVYALAWSPTSEALAVASKRKVVLRKATAGPRDEPLREFIGHKKMISRLAFSPDGRSLLSASHDGTVRLWDVASGQERTAFDWQIGPITAAAFSPDGMRAAAGGIRKVVVWDLDE